MSNRFARFAIHILAVLVICALARSVLDWLGAPDSAQLMIIILGLFCYSEMRRKGLTARDLLNWLK